ncbi:hypothetical protein HU200_044313 [Digitaria exilis]|uniref:Uncharacterized protein n=1 Tax=Digitaria exilis TaxID=1010633 RepID=A0A835B209_9POAL|nr:hypothetical protein HU200_044313 [Digitaria exilis]
MISGKHDYLPDPESLSWKQVRDHCNGLVLIRGYGADDIWYVLNPATRWVDSFHSPPPAMGKMDTYEDMYLVYDPAVSPDYEVVSVSRHMHSDNHTVERDPAVEQSEWPPSVCILQVFSSRTGEWEERSFAREGRAIGTVADMRDWHQQRNAVYWRGALYIHCQSDFVMRVSLESDKYHVIEPPTGIENLVESGAPMEWVLKHDKDLLKWLLKNKLQYSRPFKNHGQKVLGPWTLEDINYYYDDFKYDYMDEPVKYELEGSSQVSVDEKSPCNSDNEDNYSGYMDILGFHPFEEIIFLSESITRGLAYHFNSSKVEILGNLYPAGYEQELGNEQLIMSSFPYTPCWLGQTADR